MSQWNEMEALFHDALKRAAGDREAYVRSVCADAEMCEQVLAMIRQAQTGSHTGIGDAVAGAARSAQEEAGSALRPDDVVGRYRVLRHIADGGMGSVYAGERADGQYQQRVAIKSLQGRFASAAARGHFLAERQFLASLDHPNIARLLDGGVDRHGTPYLVMEFVEGLPLDRYCRDQARSLEQRLALFQKVCQAVQVAHNNLIVHRDIKPSNILVTSDGEPKLLDFGIAKLLDDSSTEGGKLTEAGDRMMTLDYAAPEQILGQRITTAADVYSLGVLLYELLSGRSPYSRWDTAPLELLNAIANTEPERPSAVTDAEAIGNLPPAVAASWKRRLRGDLDHIVLKAMRKEPARRFSSPADMADDIERFLQGRPVEARNGNWQYRAGKFLRRNAGASAAAAAVTIAIVALVSYYTFRLQAERDVAEDQRLAAEQTTQFVLGLLTSADPDEEDPNMPVSSLLAEGAERIERDLADRPVIAGRLLLTIGRAFWSIKQDDQAESLMRRALAKLQSALPESDLQIASAYAEIATALTRQERYDEAIRMYEKAKASYIAHHGPAHDLVAGTIIDMTRVYAQRDRHPTPEQYRQLAEVRAIYDTLGKQATHDYAVLEANVGNWHKLRFEWDAAERHQQAAVKIDEQIFGDKEASYAWTIEDLARIQYFMGDFVAAVPSFERVMRAVESFKGPNHVDMNWSVYYRARIAREQGDHAYARRLFQKAVDIETATPQTPDNRYLARALCGLALVQADAGELDAAQDNCTRGLEILKATDQQRIQLDDAHEALTVVALARGDVAEGLKHAQALEAIRRAEANPAQTDTPLAIALSASAHGLAGQSERAEALYAEALELAHERYPDGYPAIARIHWARAQLRESLGQADAAAADRQQAQALFAVQKLQAQTRYWTMPAATP